MHLPVPSGLMRIDYDLSPVKPRQARGVSSATVSLLPLQIGRDGPGVGIKVGQTLLEEVRDLIPQVRQPLYDCVVGVPQGPPPESP